MGTLPARRTARTTAARSRAGRRGRSASGRKHPAPHLIGEELVQGVHKPLHVIRLGLEHRFSEDALLERA
jgi:hypothetical protein